MGCRHEERDNVPRTKGGGAKRHVGKNRGGGRLAPLVIPIAAVGIILLAACGGDEESTETPTATPEVTTAVPGVEEPETSGLPIPELSISSQSLLPCHIDLAAAAEQRPSAEATPEVIRIQLLEHPYRVVPENLVLVHNRWYQLEITTGNEWHSFAVAGVGDSAVGGLDVKIDYDIPPGGVLDILVHTYNTGEFSIEDRRHWSYLTGKPTLTIIPEGASVTTWNSIFCGRLQIRRPTLGASVSTPLVLQGTISLPFGSENNVTRIEAWSNGEQVGLTTGDMLTLLGSQTDFSLTLPRLSHDFHSLLLIAYQGNGKIVAAASYPLSVLPDPVDTTASRSYRATIDSPVEEGLYSIPLTVQGWAVITGSKSGTGVGSVEIWNGPRESGQFLTEATYGIYRPDVAEALGDPRFATSGFTAQLTDLPAGPVELFVYIRDRESGEYVSPRFLRSPPSRRVRLVEGKVTDAAWPVALAAAPDGRLFYAELLTGSIRVIQDGELLSERFATLEDVANFGESGLLGLTLHPNFLQTPYVYAMYVVRSPDNGLPIAQRVVRFRDANNIGQDYSVILDNLPATKKASHNGGRISFGHDGRLYVTIGDTAVPELAQDPTRLEGSILRFNPDGTIPHDNPFPGSPIYATGLRNVFGLAFQPDTGFLYASENGPGGFDEVNKIESGRNYGWPLHTGVAKKEGFSDPIAVYGIWRKSPTYGPTGATFTFERPDLFLFCGFHTPGLHAVDLGGSDYTTVEHQMTLSDNCILDVTASDDGYLYYSTVSAIYRARLDDLLRLHEQNAQ